MGFWTCSAAFPAYGNVSPKWRGTAHFPGQIFFAFSQLSFFGKILVEIDIRYQVVFSSEFNFGCFISKFKGASHF
jgi:hypothetical protein